MNIDFEQAKKLEEIFMPSIVTARKPFYDADPERRVRLAHYTSAETAVNIIRSKTLWLRNARNMKDFSEVRYGYSWVHQYFEDAARRTRFLGNFQRADGNPASAAIDLFNKWLAEVNFGTFIGCFSAHGPECEPHGRLSMWRAFSKKTAGVALILNVPVPYAALPMFTFLSPVHYPVKPEDHWVEFEKILQNVEAEANKEFLKDVPAQLVSGWIFNVLLMLSVSLKHAAFEEEREWRLCHFPGIFQSPHVTKRSQSIEGIPQMICEASLKNKPDQEINGIDFAELFHSLKIGPTQHADAVWPALVAALEEAGIPDASKKVSYSTIPLRD